MTLRSRYHVLVVDDDAAIRKFLALRLSLEPDLDLVLTEARDGFEAIAQTLAATPDVIVLDTQMPNLRGDDAIPLLRAAAPAASILMHTGDRVSSAPAPAGPDAVVVKGAPLADLVAQLRALLGAASRTPAR